MCAARLVVAGTTTKTSPYKPITNQQPTDTPTHLTPPSLTHLDSLSPKFPLEYSPNTSPQCSLNYPSDSSPKNFLPIFSKFFLMVGFDYLSPTCRCCCCCCSLNTLLRKNSSDRNASYTPLLLRDHPTPLFSSSATLLSRFCLPMPGPTPSYSMASAKTRLLLWGGGTLLSEKNKINTVLEKGNSNNNNNRKVS